MRVLNKVPNLKTLDINLTAPDLQLLMAQRFLETQVGILFGFIPVDTTYVSGTNTKVLPCLSNINNGDATAGVTLSSDYLINYSDISNLIETDNTNITSYYKVTICGQNPYTTDVDVSGGSLTLSIANIPNYIYIPNKAEGDVPFDYMGGFCAVRLSGCQDIYIPNVVTSTDTSHEFIVGLMATTVSDTSAKLHYTRPVVIVIDKTDYNNSAKYYDRNIVKLFKVSTEYIFEINVSYLIRVYFDDRDEFVFTNTLQLMRGLLKQINF